MLHHLPPELVLNIANFLSLASLRQLRATCVPLAEALVEAKAYSCRFEQVRVRMYERNCPRRRITIPIRNSIEAIQVVLSSLHPSLSRHLREVTFLLGPWLDDKSLVQVQSALRKIFIILGSMPNAHVKIRLSRGGLRCSEPFFQAPSNSNCLPKFVFRELLCVSASEKVRYSDLLLNLESDLDVDLLQLARSLLKSTVPGWGLRCLTKLHFNIPSPRRGTFTSVKELFDTSYNAVRHYAGMISLPPELQDLNLSSTDGYGGLEIHFEGYTVNRILQESTLPLPKSLRLSGSLRLPCWCTVETIMSFLDRGPVLENLALSNIVLRGKCNNIFDWIAKPTTKLNCYSLSDLSFWTPSGETPDPARLQEVYFFDGIKPKRSIHVTGDTDVPVQHQDYLPDFGIVQRRERHCRATLAEFMTSWKEEDLAALSDVTFLRSLKREPMDST